METLEAILRGIELGAFVLLGLVSLRLWRRHGGAASAWAAATFGGLGLVALTALFLPQDPPDAPPDWVTKLLVIVIVLLPYFLFRFAGSFVRPTRRLEQTARALTGVVLVATVALPDFPQAGEPRGGLFGAYIAILLVQWTILSAIVALRLWRAGAGQPRVARGRMRLLALGAAGMNLALVVGGAAPSEEATVTTITTQVLGLIAAAGFAFGLNPPLSIRTILRRPEQEELRRAIGELMTATRADEVAERLLPSATAIVGASASALVDRSGALLGTHGVDAAGAEAFVRELGDGRPLPPGIIRLDLNTGRLIVWASPYTPYFGREEVELLHTLGDLADLALERCALISREREFIANAAHELRTPLTTLVGIGESLKMHRREMPEEMLGESIEALHRQSERARALINNLLDIAQLENPRSPVELRAVPLADSVRRALEAAPPPAEATIDVAVADDLSVEADPDRMDQILVNLLTNAYRHGGEKVWIEARGEARAVMLAVVDDGEGVDESVAPRLFEPFARGARPGVQGSGLGLAIVRRLVEMFGGRVWYEPNTPRGARFEMRLRRAS